MYTLEDLENARAKLKHQEERWSSYRGNNPNKYRSDVKSARFTYRLIQDYLKSIGVIELTEKEKLEKELDEKFPDVQSKEIVEYNGKRYKRLYFPGGVSNSGKTVKSWGRTWEELS